MKKAEVKIGEWYAAKVNGKVVPVELLAESSFGGWRARSGSTGREIRIKSAAKLRFRVKQNPVTGGWVRAD